MPSRSQQARTVGISGIGAVSALGLGWTTTWEGLSQAKTNLAPARRFDTSGFRSKLVGEVPDFKATDFVPKSYRKAVKVMARDTVLAVAAAKLAVEDAGIITRSHIDASDNGNTPKAPSNQTYPSSRMGCQIGAGLIAAETEELSAAMHTARSEAGKGAELDLKAWGGSGTQEGAGTGMEQLTPLWLLKYLPNMLACHVTIIHGCEAPSNTITCSEASGLLSIGESTRVIQRGAADICFSGGVESKVNPMGLLRLDLAGWLAASDTQTDGSKLVKPYDPAATGSIASEGGGVLILESVKDAHARGARLYARIAGIGSSTSDPMYERGEEDEGYRYAILNALDDAGVKPEQIDAIVPMACGVPRLDRAEFGALRSVFGDRLKGVPLVTLVSQIGQCMAGMGALQAAAAAACLERQFLPGRVHHGHPRSRICAGVSQPASAKLQYVLVCSGSLGGQNAAIVLARA